MKTVFVVGAGPAGIFAAQKIALAGHQVVIFNRDIKLGGLAEYGIYLVKDKMKSGLRKQFAKVLALPNVQYFGHMPVGTKQAITVDDLRAFNPDAIVFSVGAQGTKKLGLPGEDAKGVYCAKDYVYFYNSLPPFASQDFSTGKKVAIVGMGCCKFGENWDKDPQDMIVEAAYEAYADAGLDDPPKSGLEVEAGADVASRRWPRTGWPPSCVTRHWGPCTRSGRSRGACR